MAIVRIEWPVCLDGYRIETRVARPGILTIVSDAGPTKFIVANSRRFETRTPLQVHDGVWRQLAAEQPIPSDALDFANRFGLLRHKEREPLESITNSILVMRSLVTAIEKNDWETLSAWLEEHQDTIRLNPFLDWSRERPDPDLFFVPTTLGDAIFLQAFQDATKGTELLPCDNPNCKEYFAVGPGTGRRRTRHNVRYCSDKCRNAHVYMKQKERKKR